MNHKFLVHKRGDHVGVAVTEIGPGEHIQGIYMDDESAIEIDAKDGVPLGHKIAVSAVDAGGTVIEYGIPIGNAPDGFDKGAYVHTHNLRSTRW